MTTIHRSRAHRTRRLLVGAALLVLLASAGCRGAPQSSSAPNRALPSTGEPRIVDPDTGLSVSAVAVDFGRVRVLDQARREVRVRNDGSATVSITAIQSSEGFPSEAFTYSSSPFNLGPGREVTLAVAFHPTQPVAIHGSLVLVVEHGDQSALTVDLSGTGYRGESPQLFLAPNQVAFGSTMVTTTAVRHLTLANDGVDVPGTTADNLHFGAVARDETWVEQAPTVVGPDAANFSIDWPPAGYGAQGMLPGQSVVLRVRFRPDAERESQATLVIASNDPTHPRIELDLSGLGVPFVPCELELSPRVLNFRLVESEQAATQIFSMVNPDPDPTHSCEITVYLSPATESEGAFRLPDTSADTTLIRGGDRLEVPVAFVPPRDGAFDGEVVIEVAGPTPKESKVAVGGVGLPPCLVIDPLSLDFGSIGVDCRSRQRIFTMLSRCPPAISVAVEAIEVQQGDSFLVTKKPALPVSLTTGSEFGVTFHPRALGDHAGTIVVSVRGRPPVSVLVLGRGMPGELQTDLFTMDPPPKVDTLFVVDNSSSMADKQSSLARNFASVIHYAVQQKIDYHIAATTTDVTSTGAAGQLVAASGTNPAVITPSTPNKEQVFLQNVAVGTSGSETESLLYPAYLALSSPLIGSQGFYRPDAKLSIVIVSDAADQDPLSNPSSFYENFFLNLKGLKRRNDMMVSAIVPLEAQEPADCTYDTPSAGLDTHVTNLVRNTGGLRDEICNPDWSKTLEKLGIRVFGMRTTFFLSDTPDMTVTPDPIIIFVDHLPFPQYGAKGDKRWDYNSASNAVEFDPLAVPDPGSTIEITYHVACL